MSREVDGRVRALLAASPGLSDGAIAKEAGTSRNTVARARRALVAAGAVPESIARRGADGKVRTLPGKKAASQPVLSAAEREECLSVIKRAAEEGSLRAAIWLMERDATGVAPEPNVPADDDEHVSPPDSRSDLFARLQARKERGSPRHRPQGETA